MGKHYSRREIIGYSVATGAVALVAGQGTLVGALGVRPRRRPAAGEELVIEGAEVVTDPSSFPSEFHERPEFADMVEAGTLPPVADRIGQHPLVIRPVQGTGQYGGQLRRAFIGTTDWHNANFFAAGPDNFLYWDFRRENIVPNIALDHELSEDFTQMTLHLRQGMRWSDGEPFTADDIVFWSTELNSNPEISGGAGGLKPGGQPTTIEKVDDYTLLYTSAVPHPLLPSLMASFSDVGGLSAWGQFGTGGYAPAHYVGQFLPSRTSEEEATRMATDAGFESWAAYVKNRNSWFLNPELPTLTPWIVTRPLNDPPWELTANPYSIWVDTDGNQLPYIGDITMHLTEGVEVITLQATNGELDFQDRHLEVQTLPVLLENEQRSDCTLHRTLGEEIDLGMRFNLAYEADPVIGELIRTVEFRRALSLAIDRDEINEAFYLGTCIPTATVPLDSSPYFPGEEWRTKWAVLDVAQANELLDSIGLTDKDGDGFRLRPDGDGNIRLDYTVSQGFGDRVGVGEMVSTQWREIGIEMVVNEVQGSLLVERTIANDLVLSAHQVGTSDPFLRADSFLPTVTSNYPGMIGIPYAQWFLSGGEQGTEPPESLQLLKDAMALWQEGLQAAEERRIEIGKELYMMHADQVWSAGIVGFGVAINGMYYAKNNLRNVPSTAVNSLHMKTPSNLMSMTFYYE